MAEAPPTASVKLASAGSADARAAMNYPLVKVSIPDMLNSECIIAQSQFDVFAVAFGYARRNET